MVKTTIVYRNNHRTAREGGAPVHVQLSRWSQGVVRRVRLRHLRWVALAAGVAAPAIGLAQPAPAPGALCQSALDAAEPGKLLPTRLLDAVATAESGRLDPATGRQRPWPWTINVNGAGRFFETAAEAITFVRSLQAQGVRSIDVGCMQVNLMYHPDAFASLEEAFDPRANILYARRFLLSLYRRSGDWPTAVGLYHSATPALAATYRARVLGIPPVHVPTPAERERTALAMAWRATLSSSTGGGSWHTWHASAFDAPTWKVAPQP